MWGTISHFDLNDCCSSFTNRSSPDCKEVLSAMRSYVRSFFGCRECAEHFENMATEIVTEVSTLQSAVIWLWSRHNRVNNRLAGTVVVGTIVVTFVSPFLSFFPLFTFYKNNIVSVWNKIKGAALMN